MKVLNLTNMSRIYTSSTYLLTGNWNKVDDVNTLFDSGREPEIFARIVYTFSEPISYIDQVLLNGDNIRIADRIFAITTVYFGHGPPLDHGCTKAISNTMENITKA